LRMTEERGGWAATRKVEVRQGECRQQLYRAVDQSFGMNCAIVEAIARMYGMLLRLPRDLDAVA